MKMALFIMCISISIGAFAEEPKFGLYRDECTSWPRIYPQNAPTDPKLAPSTAPFPRLSYVVRDLRQEPIKDVYRFYIHGFFQNDQGSNPVSLDGEATFQWLNSGAADEKIVLAGQGLVMTSKPLRPTLNWEDHASYVYGPDQSMTCFLPY